VTKTTLQLLDELRDEIRGAFPADAKDAAGKPPADALQQKLAAARTAAERDANAIHNYRTRVSAKLNAALDKIADTSPDEPRGAPDVWWMLGMAILLLMALWSYASASWWPGTMAVALADAAMFAILVIAAIRSNETYDRLKKLSPTLYNTLPSRICAIPVVTLLILTLSFGFAGIFAAEHTALAGLSALYHSVITLTGLGLADAAILDDGLRRAMMFELGSSILLIVCILALLVNRISDF